ncbi:MAG TPA: fused MFS/spermidine synthase, partial [Planctomycetota bacterium]|nr:fused MFS/spermidine synthase [Planctomycetota bacterium]
MSTPAPGTAPLRRRFTPAVLLLFAGSGCAALIYEVVWFHLLRLVVGGSAVSLGFLLGSFMGGLGLGSLLLPRLLPARLHPLRVYAALELGIGAIGFAMPTLLPALGRAYAEAAGAGSPLLRGAVCAVALLPPTILMGATLPAIARWLDTTREGLSTMGRFYAANIVGAVAGTLLSGFWLMRVYDSVVASQVAAALNVFVAAVAILLAGRERFVPAPVPSAEGPVRRAWPVYLAIAASGCTALGAQVAWSRLLALLFGASVYTFSAILSVFLVGLGAGSSIGARLSARVRSPMVAFALCQLLLAPALLYSAWMITEVIPAAAPHLVFRDGVYQDPLWRMPYDIARCALAILPGPVLWGMSFPLAIAAAGEGHRDPGRLVGGISALNTAGAIVGALAGALAIELVGGSRQQQQALAAIAAATGLVLLLARARGPVGAVAAVAAAAVVSPSVWPIPPVPPGLIASGRFVEDWNAPLRYLFVREGMNSSVAVTEDDNGIRCFHVCGKVEASSQAIDMRLQRMLGHLPALAHGAPRKVLIVGCGAGVTAGCFVDHPSVERIVLCEIEPNVLDAARGFF